jgi:IS1 family transposase
MSRTCWQSAASTSAMRRYGTGGTGSVPCLPLTCVGSGSAGCAASQWKWYLDEVYVKINGEMHYLWRAVDQEGEVLESYITRTRDKAAALRFMKKALKRHGSPEAITTDGLRSYKAALDELGNSEKQEIGRWANNRVENSHLPFRRRERDAEVPADEEPAEIRLGPRQRPQPL